MPKVPQEIIYVTDHYIKCSGEAEKIGHPTIYLDLGSREEIDCPYCGVKFKLKSGKES